ncbi:hypothetical protein ACVIU4_003009 [Bradyrhizobium barranii subsp. barranii]
MPDRIPAAAWGTNVARRSGSGRKRGTRRKAGARPGSGQGVLGKGFFGAEIFDQLDDLETLSRPELQERAKEAQTFNGAACRRAELKVQFSREIGGFSSRTYDKHQPS